MALRKRAVGMALAFAVSAAIVVLEAPVRAVSFPATLARDIGLGGDGGWVSTSLPPTHVAFSWTGAGEDAIRYRVVSDGDESVWRVAHESDEMATDGRHYSGVFAVDRPDAIEWKAIDTDIAGVTLHEINTLDGPLQTAEAPGRARALAATPDIVTRAEWGADESIKRTRDGCRRRFYPMQQLFVHHTAGSNHDPDPDATMRAIYWYHVKERGWCDIGYNFVIGSTGLVYEGRWARAYGSWEAHDSEDRKARAVAGAHVAGHNAGSVGISLMGNYESVRLPKAMRETLTQVLAWETDRHNLRPEGKHTYRNPESGLTRKLPLIAGHRDAGQTACPGRRVYKALAKIREEVTTIVGPGRTSSKLTLRPSADRISYGDAVAMSGRLKEESGAPLPGRSVTLYWRGPRGKWRAVAAPVTGPAGEFSVDVAPSNNRRMAAVFSGEEGVWETDSRIVDVGVAPLVTLAPEGGVVDDDGDYRFEAGTTAVRLQGDVDPAHASRRVTVRVSKQRADGSYRELVRKGVYLDSESAYRYRFVLPQRRAATYRAMTRFSGDADHAAASSPRVSFSIES